jgi:hypothetical protein
MSAFIVDDLCIRRILTGFERAEYQTEGLYCTIRPPRPTVGNEERHATARALLEMNVEAVNHRYAHNGEQPVPAFREGPAGEVTDWQVLKSLDCYLYQCSEGDIPKSEFYKAVTNFRNALRAALVSQLPEYEAAKWG